MRSGLINLEASMLRWVTFHCDLGQDPESDEGKTKFARMLWWDAHPPKAPDAA